MEQKCLHNSDDYHMTMNGTITY